MELSPFEIFMSIAVVIIYCITAMSFGRLLAYGKYVKEIRDQFDDINSELDEVKYKLSSLKD